MTELARLKFYATQPHSCSYLPDEQATTLFLDPSQPIDPGATAVHGIRDADVRGVAGVSMWNDLSIRAVFRSIAESAVRRMVEPARMTFASTSPGVADVSASEST